MMRLLKLIDLTTVTNSKAEGLSATKWQPEWPRTSTTSEEGKPCAMILAIISRTKTSSQATATVTYSRGIPISTMQIEMKHKEFIMPTKKQRWQKIPSPKPQIILGIHPASYFCMQQQRMLRNRYIEIQVIHSSEKTFKIATGKVINIVNPSLNRKKRGLTLSYLSLPLEESSCLSLPSCFQCLYSHSPPIEMRVSSTSFVWTFWLLWMTSCTLKILTAHSRP